jgi:ferric enterobactin receptor
MKHLLLWITLFCFFGANAQNAAKGKIAGKIKDATTKAAVEYATIAVYQQGSTKPINGTTSDTKGDFIISNLAPGEYQISVEFLGYQKFTAEHLVISSTQSTVTLNNIALAPSQRVLKGVTVTAQAATVENHIDKMVYNTGNDLTSQGGVATDVLRKVPQITVDIDGNVELQGNSNIRFLINGKPSSIFGASLADALQSIPASQIKSIEVITSPGAKYDAAGTGGIINIILKDSQVQGINGSVNLSAGTRLENGSFNLSARKGKFGVNAFFSGNARLNSNTVTTTNRTSYSGADTVTKLNQNGSSYGKRSGYQSGINFNYAVTPKSDLTASFNFNHFGSDGSGLTNQDQSITGANAVLLSDQMSVRNSSSQFHTNAYDWGLNYKKSFAKENQELDIAYNASYADNSSSYFQQENYINFLRTPTGSSSNNPGKDKQTNISIDYTQPINDKVTIETGAKTVIENINNTVDVSTLRADNSFALDPKQTYAFNYNRYIYAYYLSTTFSLFNYLDIKAGLRYEYTSNQADFPNTNIPSYNTFAPSFVASHKINKSQTIKLSYTHRIERPDYGDLNPFYNLSDPHNVSTGNPNLQPELGHNFELGYNNSFDKGANINIAAFYRYNTQDIQGFTQFYSSYQIPRDTLLTNVNISTRINVGSEVRTGVNLSGSVPLTKNFDLRTNILLADQIVSTDFNDGRGLITVKSFAYRMNLNGTYRFAPDLAAEFFFNYNGAQKGIQGERPAFMFYNIAVRKQLWNKKASIGLTAANPFNEVINQKSTTFGTNFYQESLRQVPFRSFGISFSYKFGKLEFKKKEDDNEQNAPPMDGGGR